MPWIESVAMGGLVLLLLQGPAPPLGRLPSQEITDSNPSAPPERIYGAPEPAEVDEIQAGRFVRQAVVVKGVLRPLEAGFYELVDGASVIAVIPMPELQGSLGRLLGRRVEAKGFVRELVAKQGTCMFRGARSAPQSLCDDPSLPPTPDLADGREMWPRMSLTVWSASDVTALSHAAGGADTVADALAAAVGQRMRVRGQFGGANLDKDLETAAPERDAWVLRSGASAIWVIGKAPQGKGFRLDPAFRGDLGKGLEVEGRMASCAGTPCLKAGRIWFGAAPPPREDEP